MGKHAPLTAGANCALDEAGDGRTLCSRPGEEGHELQAEDFGEGRLLGLVANGVGEGEKSAGSKGGKAKLSSSMCRFGRLLERRG